MFAYSNRQAIVRIEAETVKRPAHWADVSGEPEGELGQEGQRLRQYGVISQKVLGAQYISPSGFPSFPQL